MELKIQSITMWDYTDTNNISVIYDCSDWNIIQEIIKKHGVLYIRLCGDWYYIIDISTFTISGSKTYKCITFQQLDSNDNIPNYLINMSGDGSLTIQNEIFTLKNREA